VDALALVDAIEWTRDLERAVLAVAASVERRRAGGNALAI
jgi:hypothetical protein